MSVSSQPVEIANWKPSISEIAELLQTLGISPPQSFDDNLPISPQISFDSSKIEDQKKPEIDKFEVEAVIDENFEREATIEQLQAAREHGKSVEWKNNYFHEYLVEHFRRKQMTQVCTSIESEDDVLLNEYLRKLDELERSNADLRGSCEEWDAELAKTCADIRGRKETARKALNEMIGKERVIGGSTWYCGKPLSLKRVQALIAKQLDRIRNIAKFRIRYMRLRTELREQEAELRRQSVASPDLSKEDYERLEAEQFCYKRDSKAIDQRCEELRRYWDSLVNIKAATIRTIASIDRTLNHCVWILSDLKNSLKTQLRARKTRLLLLADAKLFIRNFEDTIEQTQRPEFVERVSKLREEHQEWMKRIAALLKTVKYLGQSLNSRRANLMLRGELKRSVND